MSNGDQSKRPPVDRTEQPSTKKPESDRAAAAWNQAALQRAERALPAKERTERATVARPNDGVGFRFGADKLEAGELERFMSTVPQETQARLRSGRARVVITALASRAGSAEHNQDLTDRRAQEVRDRLTRDFGVPGKSIEMEPLGEEPAKWRGAADGADQRHDRVAIISIINPGPEAPRRVEPSETAEQSVARAKDVLRRNRPANARVAVRLDLMIAKLGDASADDQYIPGRVIFGRDQPHDRPPLATVVERVRPRIRRLMNEPMEGGRAPSDSVLLSRLERLDADIASGPQMVARNKGLQGPTASAWLLEIDRWIADRQRRTSCVMSAYAEDR